MSNLSELSVQLRRLQSEKNGQAGEIDRLQRQLRILAELKGVSVADVQAGLRAECAAEAHGELRAIVGTLRARVEALGAGGAGGSAAGARGNHDEKSNVRTQERFSQEAAARARAALELRIGELEEVEATLRAETDSLYKNSQGLTERNTSLETQVLQQKAQLEQWERRWQAREDEEARRGGIVPAASPSAGSYNYSNFSPSPAAAGAATPPPMLLHNAPQSTVDDAQAQRLIAAESALSGEKQQRSLVENQLSSAQKSYELKMDQNQHRCQFLEEQLTDLEQQMSSLYAAFGIMQNDTKEERHKTEAWKRTMLETDTAIAQEESRRELEQGAGAHDISDTKGKLGRRQSLPAVPRSVSPSPSSPPSLAAVEPTHPPIAKGLLKLLLDRDGRPLPPNHVPATPRSRGTRGKLSFKLSKSPSKRGDAVFKFKKQLCVLHGSNGLYQLRYGDTFAGPVTGVLEFITVGCSSISHTPRSSGLPFGFEIMINASNADAPVLCCAADTEEDFLMWMAALTSVM